MEECFVVGFDLGYKPDTSWKEFSISESFFLSTAICLAWTSWPTSLDKKTYDQIDDQIDDWSTNQPASQPTNQPTEYVQPTNQVHQPVNQVHQPTRSNQSTRHCQPTNQPINLPTNQPTN